MSDPLIPRPDRIAQRRRCTGESAWTVQDQLRDEPGPLMPVPASREQVELEAALLRVWTHTVALLGYQHSGSAGAALIKQVCPSRRMLTLEIDQRALCLFVAAALPSIANGRVTGIPGLRVRPDRKHVDLVLIGGKESAEPVVRLKGVTRERWREAEHWIRRDRTTAWLGRAAELHQAEAAPLQHHHTESDVLMSAVLRRVPMWSDVTWLDVQVHGRSLLLYWRGGPTSASVSDTLEDPLCGIAGTTVVTCQLPGALRGVAVTCSDATTSEMLAAELAAAAPAHIQPILAEVWDQQEMRDALARREISSVYRLLRRHGVSQRQIAALTGQSQSEVSEILKGRQVMAYDVLTRIAVGLGVPSGSMGLAYDETTAVRVAAAAGTSRPDDEESVRRRKFLAHAAAVTVGAAVFGADSGSWVSHPTQTPADVRQVEAATRALRALDLQYGGGSCREAVAAQLSWARQVLVGKPVNDAVKARLSAAIADLRSLAR
ncbi:helix-turn-helix transcriptional regulator [Nocardia sp. NRRL S-836]|uniref:helix-turn-helix domain-containing protein n=1 Tax=Nocardia sp. NRRL S-836 TaxID=1519492 RepID=UPI000ADB1DCD|nr:helix-turn-helix transcriptional regulator [Nocardia sp. NRRL S-836]